MVFLTRVVDELVYMMYTVNGCPFSLRAWRSELQAVKKEERYRGSPSFLAASSLVAGASRVLASYRVSRDCSQSNLDDAFSVVAIWTEF